MPPPMEPTLAALPQPLPALLRGDAPGLPFRHLRRLPARARHRRASTASLRSGAGHLLHAVFRAGGARRRQRDQRLLRRHFRHDAANTERQFPFTGGSRFIQNGVLGLRATGLFGYALLAAVVPAGLWLTAVRPRRPDPDRPGRPRSSAGPIRRRRSSCKAAAWASSRSPRLAAGGGRQRFRAARRLLAFLPVAAGLGFALLVANVLYINQFPDVKGRCRRRQAHHGGAPRPGPARWGYVLITALAYGWPLLMVLAGRLPLLALLALLPVAGQHRRRCACCGQAPTSRRTDAGAQANHPVRQRPRPAAGRRPGPAMGSSRSEADCSAAVCAAGPGRNGRSGRIAAGTDRCHARRRRAQARARQPRRAGDDHQADDA
jgi:hypothetical protein